MHARLHSLVRSEYLSHAALASEAATRRIPARSCFWLQRILAKMTQLRPGRYLATHAAGAAHISFFEALKAEARVGCWHSYLRTPHGKRATSMSSHEL